MTEMAKGFAPGAKMIVDGAMRTFVRMQPDGVTGVSISDETGKEQWFDAREVRAMGGGFFCLPGRIEAPKSEEDLRASGVVVLTPATAVT